MHYPHIHWGLTLCYFASDGGGLGYAECSVCAMLAQIQVWISMDPGIVPSLPRPKYSCANVPSLPRPKYGAVPREWIGELCSPAQSFHSTAMHCITATLQCGANKILRLNPSTALHRCTLPALHCTTILYCTMCTCLYPLQA